MLCPHTSCLYKDVLINYGVYSEFIYLDKQTGAVRSKFYDSASVVVVAYDLFWLFLFPVHAVVVVVVVVV